MIAIALSCRLRVLVAEEPTRALDVMVPAQIWQIIRVLQVELGMGTVMAVRDPRAIAGTADGVVVMDGGRVMERAPVHHPAMRRNW